MTAQIDVQFASHNESTPDADTISGWVATSVATAAGPSAFELSVRIVDSVEMQALNGEFRSRHQPTNVLSFPAGAISGLPPDAEVPLGDIVICDEVVCREATEQGKPLGHHWAHMIVHGSLHLLGFDHEEEGEAARMEGLEIAILANFGIPNPYGESPQET
jgi:probable rRNA maturation factor